jgi:hypothetical protein
MLHVLQYRSHPRMLVPTSNGPVYPAGGRTHCARPLVRSRVTSLDSAAMTSRSARREMSRDHSVSTIDDIWTRVSGKAL